MEMVQVLEGLDDLGCGCDNQPMNGLGDFTEAQATFGTFALFAGIALVVNAIASRRARRSPVTTALRRARANRQFGFSGVGD
jgi:hypothetical protein